jgi:hypothetical protein
MEEEKIDTGAREGFMTREVKNETEIFDYVELDKITQINGYLQEL